MRLTIKELKHIIAEYEDNEDIDKTKPYTGIYVYANGEKLEVIN